MDPEPQTTSTAVLDGHPTERSLARFAANDMGPQRKKVIVRHLETCQDCRKAVTRFHDIARRYRDLERRAIQHVATEFGR